MGELGRFKRLALCCGIAILPVACQPAGATDLRNFCGVREYTLGSALFLPAEMAWRDARRPRRTVRLEINEFRLLGIHDLVIDAARAGIARRRGGIGASVAQLRTPVGHERLVGLVVNGIPSSWLRLELRLDYQRIQLDGLEPVSLLRGGMRMCARMGSTITAGYSIGDLSLMGEGYDGIDLSIFLYAHMTSRTGCYACVTVHREGISSIGAGVLVRPVDPLRIIVAYDDGTELLKGMISLERGPFELRFGSGLHPVLGVTNGLSLVWGV